VDEEDEDAGGGSASVASRKTRARAGLTALAVVGTVVTAFLTTGDGEKRPHYMKKEGVILTGIPSNKGGVVRASCTV
jgi:hypothetical protein